jgi:hypothetical protein
MFGPSSSANGRAEENFLRMLDLEKIFARRYCVKGRNGAPEAVAAAKTNLQHPLLFGRSNEVVTDCMVTMRAGKSIADVK